MISHQDARRNLSPGELIYANSMVAEEIALENKEKMLEGTLNSHEVRKKMVASKWTHPKIMLETVQQILVNKWQKCQVLELALLLDLIKL